MKATTRILLLLLLAVALAWPVTVFAQGPQGDKFVFGGVYTLSSSETLDGNLYVFGGVATVEKDAQVNGGVVLLGGNLEVDGQIDGNILATGGLVDLGSTAVVDGDVTTIAAHLQRAEGARISGKVNSGVSGPFNITIPGGAQVPNVQVNFNPFWNTLWFLFRSFMWAALAILVVIFLPHHTERAAQAAVTQPLLAGGVGLLTAVVVPLALLIVAITLIGIPISLLGALVLVIAWGFGLIALGTEAGRRIAQQLRQEWAPAVEAGVGTFVLVVVINGIGSLVPCIGWVVPAAAGMVGVGAVLLTRFGTQVYPPYQAQPPAAPSGMAPPPLPPDLPPSRGEDAIPKALVIPPQPQDQEGSPQTPGASESAS